MGARLAALLLSLFQPLLSGATACRNAPTATEASQATHATAAPETPVPAPALPWQPLLPGLDWLEAELPQRSHTGDSRVRALRADPERWAVTLSMASASGGSAPWPPDLMAQRGAVAATNPAMFLDDFLSSTGYMAYGSHTNQPRWADQQNSVLAATPRRAGIPGFRLLDAACDPGARAAADRDYLIRVQSIRLLGCQGEIVWSDQPKEWSVSLIGEDRGGRALLIHVRSPYRMRALAGMLAGPGGLPLDLVRLHYGEGGPESFLSVRTPALSADHTGSYETGFYERDDNREISHLPNVLLIVPRP